jgi:hypothetical protein
MTKHRTVSRTANWDDEQEDRETGPIWPRVGKGEHQALTIAEIILTHPSYFYWAYKTPTFFLPPLKEQAKMVALRAAHILPPGPKRAGKAFAFRFDAGRRLKQIEVVSTSGRKKSGPSCAAAFGPRNYWALHRRRSVECRYAIRGIPQGAIFPESRFQAGATVFRE